MRMPNAQSYDELARSITDSYSELPARLQGIARYVLGHPDAMALSTVAEIAREAQVPPSAGAPESRSNQRSSSSAAVMRSS